MRNKSAIAAVFIEAIRGLDRPTREEVYSALLNDPELLEDLIDITAIEERRNEPSRPFREVLADIRGQTAR